MHSLTYSHPSLNIDLLDSFTFYGSLLTSPLIPRLSSPMPLCFKTFSSAPMTVLAAPSSTPSNTPIASFVIFPIANEGSMSNRPGQGPSSPSSARSPSCVRNTSAVIPINLTATSMISYVFVPDSATTAVSRPGSKSSMSIITR